MHARPVSTATCLSCRDVCTMGAQLVALDARLRNARRQAARLQAPLPAGISSQLLVDAVFLVGACAKMIAHTGGVLPAPHDFYSGALLVLTTGAAALRQTEMVPQPGHGAYLPLQLRLLAEPALGLAAGRDGHFLAFAISLPKSLLMEWLGECAA